VYRDLESGTRGFAFAFRTRGNVHVLDLLESGSAHRGQRRSLRAAHSVLFDKVRKTSAGLEFTYVDLTDASRFEKASKKTRAWLWIETPSNPLLKVIDLEAIARWRANRRFFPSPTTLCDAVDPRPLEFGFDIFVHSATKYLNGHLRHDRPPREQGTRRSNVVPAKFGRRNPGRVRQLPRPAKFENAALRMERIARMRSDRALVGEQPQIEKVMYPGLKSHPQHDLARTQMRGFGGMVVDLLKQISPGQNDFLKTPTSSRSRKVGRRRKLD